jgi:hypothetical protein
MPVSFSNAKNQTFNLLLFFFLLTENRKLKTENGIRSRARHRVSHFNLLIRRYLGHRIRPAGDLHGTGPHLLARLIKNGHPGSGVHPVRRAQGETDLAAAVPPGHPVDFRLARFRQQRLPFPGKIINRAKSQQGDGAKPAPTFPARSRLRVTCPKSIIPFLPAPTGACPGGNDFVLTQK